MREEHMSAVKVRGSNVCFNRCFTGHAQPLYYYYYYHYYYMYYYYYYQYYYYDYDYYLYYYFLLLLLLTYALILAIRGGPLGFCEDPKSSTIIHMSSVSATPGS